MIQKGQLFIVTEGEYSDFQVVALCRANCDIDESRLKGWMEDYLKSAHNVHHREEFCSGSVISWLLNGMRIGDELELHELWLNTSEPLKSWVE